MNGAKQNPQQDRVEYYLVTYYCNVTRRNYTQRIMAHLRTPADAVRKCKADNDEATMRVVSVTWVREEACTGWSN